MRALLAKRSLALLFFGVALLGAAGAALAQTPVSVPTTPEPSMSATPAQPTPRASGPTAPQATGTTASAPLPAGAIVGTPQPATTGSAPAGRPTSSAPVITITQVDNGRTFNVALNQQIVLQLGATLDWSVTYQPEGILRAVPGVNALTRGTQAILYAAASGTVTITAQGKAICTAGQACPQFVAQFQASVIVAAGSTTQQPTGPIVMSPKPGSASPPAQPVRLPNTGGHDNSAPLYALLLGAAALALSGAVAWRRTLSPAAAGQRPSSTGRGESRKAPSGGSDGAA